MSESNKHCTLERSWNMALILPTTFPTLLVTQKKIRVGTVFNYSCKDVVTPSKNIHPSIAPLDSS